MTIVTKDQVLAELMVVPCELKYDFYAREVIGNDVVFHPVLR